jgi:hypothetical protein
MDAGACPFGGARRIYIGRSFALGRARLPHYSCRYPEYRTLTRIIHTIIRNPYPEYPYPYPECPYHYPYPYPDYPYHYPHPNPEYPNPYPEYPYPYPEYPYRLPRSVRRSAQGGFGMAAHNYDGDMLTDEVAQVTQPDRQSCTR